MKFNDCTTSHLAPNAAQPTVEEELVAVRLNFKCLHTVRLWDGLFKLAMLHSYQNSE